MFLIRVVPYAKLPPNAPSVLDYFWPTPLPQGSLIEARMGKRTVRALVLESADVRTAKLSVKTSSFSLKKLGRVITEQPQLTAGQLALVRWLSGYYATSLATCLKAVAPPFFGRPRSLITHPAIAVRDGHAASATVVQTQPDTARSTVEGIVARSTGQVLIVVPERSLTDSLLSWAGPGAVAVHAGLSARQLAVVYRGVLDGSQRVVIGTRSALFLPWADLEQVIVEDALHEAYKSDMAPRYNGSDVARHLASLHGAHLTWLTPALSTVQHHLIATDALPLRFLKPHWPHTTAVSMESERSEGGISLYSRAAQDALLDAYETGKPSLILSPRRGYATIARCVNCRKAIPCAVCEIPLRWHRTSEDMLVCYHCTAFISVPSQCPSCHNGTVRPSGIAGSQKYAEAFNTLLDRHGFRKFTVPILDSDLTRTPGDERDILARVDSMEHPVLVATQMVCSHRYDRTFHTIVVPNLDALAYNPDYRTQERLIATLERLADFSPSRMVVQSWQTSALGDIPGRRWEPFYSDELLQRKALLWPPFARIVKLTFHHRRAASAAQAAVVAADRLTRTIAHLGLRGTRVIGPQPALLEQARGLFTHVIVLKTSLSGPRLAELLAYLPPGWIVDVDPRSIA